MMVYDEYGNAIGDDGSGEYGYDQSTMLNYMQPQVSPAYSTQKWNFGAQLPQGQPQINQQLTGTKSINQIMADPSFRYQAQVFSGAPLFDTNALSGLDSSGMPYQGSGGGGGGGGGSNGYNPNYMTNNLNALGKAAKGTPENLIFTGITTGTQSPLSLKRAMREDGKYDTDTLKQIDAQIDAAFSEYAGAQRNKLAGQNQPAQQTPVQEWLAKNGLINPIEQYSATNLPGDIDPTAADVGGANLQARADDTGDTILRLRDQMRGIQNNGQVYDAVRQAQLRAMQMNGDTTRGLPSAPDAGFPGIDDVHGGAAQMFQVPGVTKPGAQSQSQSPVAAAIAKAVGAGQPSPLPARHSGFLSGASLNQNRYLASDENQLNHLRTQIGMQKKRQADLSQQGSDYQVMYRKALANKLQQQGRTPARDAQQALINYARQTGLAI